MCVYPTGAVSVEKTSLTQPQRTTASIRIRRSGHVPPDERVTGNLRSLGTHKIITQVVEFATPKGRFLQLGRWKELPYSAFWASAARISTPSLDGEGELTNRVFLVPSL